MMKDDPIVKKVRQFRREILAAHGGSFEAMSRDAMKRQWHSGHEVTRPVKKKCEHGVAPNIYPISGKP